MDRLGVRLVEALDPEQLAAGVGVTGEAIDGIAVAKQLQGLAEQHQGLALDLIDPTLGGAAHVHHEQHGHIALQAPTALKQPGAGLQAAHGVGIGLDDGIDVGVFALGLALDQAFLPAQGLEGAVEVLEQTPVLIPGTPDEAV